jgi:hypothetical protein
MYSNTITAINNVDSFYAYDDLQKQYAAKYLADFAKKILKKIPDFSPAKLGKKIPCRFYDLKKTEKKMLTSITEACQLGLLTGTK